MSEKLKLSRRKMLAGLGTIGIASGAAGYGTYAALNDEETQNTTFTAGELDLEVAYSASYNNQLVDGVDEDDDGKANEIELTESNEGEVNLEINDLKPGDVGAINFEIETTENSNPAWIILQTDITGSAESADGTPKKTEPEEDAPDPNKGGDGQFGTGDIENRLMVLGFYDSNDTSMFFDQGQNFDDIDLDDEPPEDGSLIQADINDDGTPDKGFVFNGAVDDETSESGPTVADPDVPTAFYANAQPDDHPSYLARTLNELATQNLRQGTNGSDAVDMGDDFEGALIVDGQPEDTSDNTQNDGDLDPLKPGGDDDATRSVNFGFDFHLPYVTGNEIQGDLLEVSFRVIAIQDRNNGLPTNADVYLNESGSNSDNASAN
jgi:predicted ribosomally synthesized peptide with SipW-like signal peptide